MASEVLTNPLKVLQSLYDENKNLLNNLEEVEKYFRVILDDDLSKVPCVNDVPLENIPANSLVHFRGMVQDMFDPEFYLAKFDAQKKETKETVERLGCYSDTNCFQDEEINFESPNNLTLTRQVYYCVPVPGENQWLKSMYRERSNVATKPVDISPVKNKRPHDDIDDVEMMATKTDECDDTGFQEKKMKNEGDLHTIETSTDQEKKKEESSKPSKLSTDYTKNFPLTSESGSPCFVKIYSNSDGLKLNDIVEFVCVLSIDPIYATTSMDDNDPSGMMTWSDQSAAEEKAHCPPPSLVPRLHCVYFNKLETINPSVRLKDVDYENTSRELSSVRADLVQLLTQVFDGDSLLAEFLLIYLISSVYGRVGTMCIGKISLNIIKCPTGRFTQYLYELIEMLVEKSHYLPLTLENLNNEKFIPRKDYDANRLISGMLQLPSGFHLVLDETKMQTGKLDSDGVSNLTAVGNLIQWQKVDYDFKFSKVAMESNVNVLVLSEGKSMLTCDCKIPIMSEKVNETMLKGTLDALSQKLLKKFRLYLAIVRSVEYNLTDEIQTALQDDFVEMRKNDQTVNADSFYILLTTARYLALSYGQDTLSSSLWTRTKELNAERIKRIKN